MLFQRKLKLRTLIIVFVKYEVFKLYNCTVDNNASFGYTTELDVRINLVSKLCK